jgi:hypothetical protein
MAKHFLPWYCTLLDASGYDHYDTTDSVGDGAPKINTSALNLVHFILFPLRCITLYFYACTAANRLLWPHWPSSLNGQQRAGPFRSASFSRANPAEATVVLASSWLNFAALFRLSSYNIPTSKHQHHVCKLKPALENCCRSPIELVGTASPDAEQIMTLKLALARSKRQLQRQGSFDSQTTPHAVLHCCSGLCTAPTAAGFRGILDGFSKVE